MPFVPTSGSQGAVTVAKSMFRRKSVVCDIIYSDVIILSKAKGQWHVIHLLGNDYSSSNSSLPKTSPVFFTELFNLLIASGTETPFCYLPISVNSVNHIQGWCKMETSRYTCPYTYLYYTACYCHFIRAFHTGKQSIGLQNMKELIQVCMMDGETRPSPQKRRLLWNGGFSSCGKQATAGLTGQQRESERERGGERTDTAAEMAADDSAHATIQRKQEGRDRDNERFVLNFTLLEMDRADTVGADR
eukprot:g33160.t1